MLQNIKDGDLIIAPQNIKNKILKELSLNKKILNIKIMSIKEFTNNYFGKYTEESLYYLMKKYKLKYGVAKEYLDNIFFDTSLLKSYYQELKEKSLLIENDLFKNSLKNIIVIGYDSLDKYILDELNKYNVRFMENKINNYIPKVYGFDKGSDEIAFIASEIVEKLKTEDINNFYLVNANNDNKSEIKRIFNLYNLPINLETSKEIYGTETVKIFIHNLEETKNIEKALENTQQNEIYNKIIDVLNKYTFIDEVDNIFIEIIKNELKNTKIKLPKLENAINVIDLEFIIDDDNYYYILDFNQGVIPRIYKDDKLIKDEERIKLGLNTSLNKLKSEKTYISKLIHNIKNLTITYKLKDNYGTYYPSPLIEELKLVVIKNPEIKLNYSHAYNKLKLGIDLDNYINFNMKSETLEQLYSSYPDIPYQTYDNGFTGVNFDDIYEHLKGKTSLSYSSMNNYFLCAFRFYISNILKLDPFKESFATLIGKLFHYCLSKMYEDGFNLEKEYSEYLKDKQLTPKEIFFVKKLYKDLEFIIETIHYQEKYSKLNKVLTEKNITVDKSSKLEVNFMGIVDKIKYLEEDGKTLVAIIDYKTGVPETKLDNINYGLHLQLPVYIYLTKNGLHKDIKIVGFYLQKILNNYDMDSNDIKAEMHKKLKLDGYTINEEEIINKFDSSYEKSEVIKGMSLTGNGFSHYAKLVSKEEIEKITNLVSDKIDEVIIGIETGKFDINPKRIDGKLVGCDFCEFKDLCFKKEEDIVNLKNTKFEDILK